MAKKFKVTDLQKVIRLAEAKCKTNNVRLTQKRKHILASLLSSEKALSAYDLIEHCTKSYDVTFPPMSVYRILDFLEQEQLVHKLSLANKYVACSHIACDHEHQVPQFLICNNCQRVKEIGIDKNIIESLQSNVQAAGFHLTSPQLEMNCICEQCNQEAA